MIFRLGTYHRGYASLDLSQMFERRPIARHPSSSWKIAYLIDHMQLCMVSSIVAGIHWRLAPPLPVFVFTFQQNRTRWSGLSASSLCAVAYSWKITGTVTSS